MPPPSPRFQLRAHTWGRLSSRIKVSVGRFHRGLRRRDSDCDGFACFLNWAMCKWGGKNRFQCLVHSHWFRKVMKTHCFYFTDLCCKPPHLRFVLGLSEHEWKWADAWTHMNIGHTVYIFREEPSRNSSGSDIMSLVPAAFLFFYHWFWTFSRTKEAIRRRTWAFFNTLQQLTYSLINRGYMHVISQEVEVTMVTTAEWQKGYWVNIVNIYEVLRC